MITDIDENLFNLKKVYLRNLFFSRSSIYFRCPNHHGPSHDVESAALLSVALLIPGFFRVFLQLSIFGTIFFFFEGAPYIFVSESV